MANRLCSYCNKPIILNPSATERARKHGETPEYYLNLFTIHANCADLVAPLSQPEIDMIRKSVKFIKGNESVKCVYMDIRNPHVIDDLVSVIGESNYEEHEQNNWSVIPLKKFTENYSAFTQSDETCRLKIWVDESNETHIDLIIGYDDEENAMAAQVFCGKRF